jgi:hypothetical protein
MNRTLVLVSACGERCSRRRTVVGRRIARKGLSAQSGIPPVGAAPTRSGAWRVGKVRRPSPPRPMMVARWIVGASGWTPRASAARPYRATSRCPAGPGVVGKCGCHLTQAPPGGSDGRVTSDLRTPLPDTRLAAHRQMPRQQVHQPNIRAAPHLPLATSPPIWYR